MGPWSGYNKTTYTTYSIRQPNNMCAVFNRFRAVYASIKNWRSKQYLFLGIFFQLHLNTNSISVSLSIRPFNSIYKGNLTKKAEKKPYFFYWLLLCSIDVRKIAALSEQKKPSNWLYTHFDGKSTCIDDKIHPKSTFDSIPNKKKLWKLIKNKIILLGRVVYLRTVCDGKKYDGVTILHHLQCFALCLCSLSCDCVC